MDFIFVDREITQTVFDDVKKSIKFSDVFYAKEDGSRGEYIGTLKNLSPEPVSKTARDYRFFNHQGLQGIYPFKRGKFNDVLEFDEAKDLLKQALYRGAQEESYGYAIVKVVQEGVDPQVPLYLNLDQDYYIWGISDFPKLISMKHLQDVKSVFYEVRKRENWVDIKDLIVVEITQDLFNGKKA